MVTLTLCAPGPWTSRDELVAAWREVDPDLAFEDDVLVLPNGCRFTVAVVPKDPDLAASFLECADPTSPSLSPEELEALPAHEGVAILASDPYGAEEAGQVAFSALMLPGMIAGAGAIAVRCDTVDLAHGLDWWIELAERAVEAFTELADESAEDPLASRYDLFDALFRAFVRGPGEDDGVYFTTGLHLLGAPDLEMDAGSEKNPALAAWNLFHLVATYALAEAAIDDGDTIRLAEDAPAFTLRARPPRFAAGDPRHNPFGAFALEPA
jgi:hypothetical protein